MQGVCKQIWSASRGHWIGVPLAVRPEQRCAALPFLLRCDLLGCSGWVGGRQGLALISMEHCGEQEVAMPALYGAPFNACINIR